MTLRSSLAVFGVGSIFAWAAFVLILFTVSPDHAGTLGEAFFFSSLFVALVGTFTICGVLGRVRRSRLLPAMHISPAFRQGVLVSFAGVGLLFLQRMRLFRWWTVLLIIGGVTLVEILLARRRRDGTALEGITS